MRVCSPTGALVRFNRRAVLKLVDRISTQGHTCESKEVRLILSAIITLPDSAEQYNYDISKEEKDRDRETAWSGYRPLPHRTSTDEVVRNNVRIIQSVRHKSYSLLISLIARSYKFVPFPQDSTNDLLWEAAQIDYRFFDLLNSIGWTLSRYTAVQFVTAVFDRDIHADAMYDRLEELRQINPVFEINDMILKDLLGRAGGMLPFPMN